MPLSERQTTYILRELFDWRQKRWPCWYDPGLSKTQKERASPMPRFTVERGEVRGQPAVFVCSNNQVLVTITEWHPMQRIKHAILLRL